MGLFHRAYRALAPGGDQRLAQPSRQARNAQVVPAAQVLVRHLAQDRIDHRPPLGLGNHLHQVIDHPVRRTAGAHLDRAQPQEVHQRQRRALAQMARQDAVGAVDPAQRVQRQPPRGGSLGWRQAGKGGPGGEIGQQLSAFHHPGDQAQGCASCGAFL